MEFQIKEAVKILQQTPAALTSLLKNLPEELLFKNEGENSWSPFIILGHFIHGEETDWIPRTKILLQHGESRPFEPFDRFAQFERFKGKNISELLKMFEKLRKKNLEILNGLKLQESQLALKGTHPEFGPVFLRQLLSAWVVHDLNHIYQIVRVVAKQYSDLVGPFKEYLAILKQRIT